MNRHFKDSQYYLRRAAITAKNGISEELAPIRARVKRLRGSEDEEEDETQFVRVRRRATSRVHRGRARVGRVVNRGTARIRKIRNRVAE